VIREIFSVEALRRKCIPSSVDTSFPFEIVILMMKDLHTLTYFNRFVCLAVLSGEEYFPSSAPSPAM